MKRARKSAFLGLFPLSAFVGRFALPYFAGGLCFHERVERTLVSVQIRVKNSQDLILLIAVAFSLGCQQRITSTAKPKPPPSIQVRVPDLDLAAITTSSETIRVPVLQPFVITVTVHGVDAIARKEGVLVLSFLPLKGSQDEEKKWFYGSAFLVPKDENAATWECTGICQGIAKPVPMRATVTLGATGSADPITEFKVEGVIEFKTEHEKSDSP